MKTSAMTLALRALLGATLLGALSACAPLIVGSAAVGVMVGVDRRTSGAQLEDEGIELRARSRLNDNLGERGHIDITSYNRQVLLTGEVPTAQDKQLAEKVVAQVENVRNIINELGVMENATLGERSKATWLTGRVKTGLIDARDLHANAFKVVSERGTVYLLGRVTQREADRATDIARSTPGVMKVVRVFEIISEEELARIDPKPVESSAEPQPKP